MSKQRSLEEYGLEIETTRGKDAPPAEEPRKMTELDAAFGKLYDGELSKTARDDFLDVLVKDKPVAGKIVDSADTWSKTLGKWEYSDAIASIKKILEDGGSELAGYVVDISCTLLKKPKMSVLDWMYSVGQLKGSPQKLKPLMEGREYVAVLDCIARNAKDYVKRSDTKNFFRSLDITQDQRDKLVSAYGR